MTSWPDAPSPAAATAQWHTEARRRDEEYLAQGPIDMTETTDGPWSGSGATNPADALRPPPPIFIDDDLGAGTLAELGERGKSREVRFAPYEQSGPAAEQRGTRLIPDPADRLTPEFLAALRGRYEGMGARDTANGKGFPSAFADACDLVTQLLWPEMYGTDPDDPNLHTSDPARQIAHLFCEVLGVSPEEDE